jgi:L-ascorbate metabolism protein UlaG (beta-lactamase superfamily)
MDPRAVGITYLGHSTVLLEMAGLRLLTDPILRARVGPLVRSEAPVPPEHWQHIDAVLISHSHWDHLDYGSLRLVGRDVPILVPEGMGARLRGRGFRQVEELSPGEVTRLGSLRIEATEAAHRGFPRPIGPTDLAIGFLLKGSASVYFPGDTALFDAMSDLARDLDLALMPVWGWGPRARASEHLDPLGAARALQLLRPSVAVPIHWGTLHPVGFKWLKPSTRVDPPHTFARLAAELAPDTTVHVLPVGGTLALGRPGGGEPGGRERGGGEPASG